MMRLAALWLLSLAAVGAPAADQHGNYAIWGPGKRSCNQFNEAYDKDDTAAYKAFLMGYLTAYNMLAGDTYNATGSNSLTDSLAWIDRYCNDHKLDSFERAITFLLASLEGERQRDGPGANRGWGRWSREARP